MVTAKNNLVFSCFGPGDADGRGHRFTAASEVADHLGPGMQLAKKIGEGGLFRAVEGASDAFADGLPHGVIHIRVGIPEDARAYASDRHVEVTPPVEIPHLGAAGL